MGKKDYTSFIFSHIPKCGGTSFREFIYKSAISSNVDTDKIYIPGYNGVKVSKNLNQLSGSELRSFSKKNYQVIAMHVPYESHLHHSALGSNPLYFSIFRDPLERFLSHYYFFYYRQGADGCKGKHLTDLTVAKRSYMLQNLSNVYASYILGDIKSGLYHDLHLLDDIIEKLNQPNYHYGILSDIDFALESLSVALSQWLHLGQHFPKVNAFNFRDTYKDMISDELVEEFNSMNTLDISVYDYILDSLNT